MRKHALFHGLCAVHAEHADEWSKLDRTPTKNEKNHKLEKSIYRHDMKIKGTSSAISEKVTT